MRILLDENLPKRLKLDLSEYEVFTVRDKKWNGLKNGELLIKLVQEDFHISITFDKNLKYQQNFSKFPITVLTIKAVDNTYLTLKNYISKIKKILKENLKPGVRIVQ
jgi:predicted nuclease of predicted toxin-antitoxin system